MLKVKEKKQKSKEISTIQSHILQSLIKENILQLQQGSYLRLLTSIFKLNNFFSQQSYYIILLTSDSWYILNVDRFYYFQSILIIVNRRFNMLELYNTLKQKLAQQGYDQALAFIDGMAALTQSQILIKTNFYCYLSLQKQHQNNRCLTILQQCLADSSCVRGIKALTKYHLCQLFFNCDMEACGKQCEQLVGEFIGNYHMLRANTERTPEQEQQLGMLQYLLYYCLLMLGYLRRNEGRKTESESYIKASQSLLKIGNRSSQLINASNLRTRSAQQKRRPCRNFVQ